MKTMKRFLSCLLIVSMIMSFMSVSAFADEIGDVPNADVPNEPVQKQWPLLEGEKTAAVLGSERTDYKVTVQVPGGEGVEKHDAVILMVDDFYLKLIELGGKEAYELDKNLWKEGKWPYLQI